MEDFCFFFTITQLYLLILNIYLNGMNRKGMMVAPGIYRSVIYISYPSSSRIKVIKLLSKIGIHR